MQKSNGRSISVVIPAYNAQATIRDVINAVQKQSASQYIKEIIVVDDGSKDGTVCEVTEQSRDSEMPIRLICTENHGVSAARNLGMREATGEWIALDDADDVWNENKIQLQMDKILSNPNIDFIGGAWSAAGVRLYGRKITSFSRVTMKNMCWVSYPQTSTVLLRKTIFDEMGGFDEKQKYAEDINYFMKICWKYRGYYMPEQLVTYGYGKKGFGDSGLSANLQEMYKGNVKNLKEFFELSMISRSFYICMRLYYWVKFIRRRVICRIRKG